MEVQVQNERNNASKLRFSSAEKCVDVFAGLVHEGNKVQAYRDTGGDPQRFRLLRSRVDGAYFLLFNGNLVVTLDPSDDSFALSENVGGDCQMWRIERVED